MRKEQGSEEDKSSVRIAQKQSLSCQNRQKTFCKGGNPENLFLNKVLGVSFVLDLSWLQSSSQPLNSRTFKQNALVKIYFNPELPTWLSTISVTKRDRTEVLQCISLLFHFYTFCTSNALVLLDSNIRFGLLPNQKFLIAGKVIFTVGEDWHDLICRLHDHRMRSETASYILKHPFHAPVIRLSLLIKHLTLRGGCLLLEQGNSSNQSHSVLPSRAYCWAAPWLYAFNGTPSLVSWPYLFETMRS